MSSYQNYYFVNCERTQIKTHPLSSCSFNACCFFAALRCFFNFLHTNQKLYISNIFKKKSSHHHLYIFYKKENILLIFLFPLFYYYDIVIKFIFIHRYISYRYIYYIYRIQNFSNHLFTDFTPDV